MEIVTSFIFLYLLQVLIRELYIGANRIIETIKQAQSKRRVKRGKIEKGQEPIDFMINIPVIHVASIVFEERLRNGIRVLNMKPDIASYLLEYDCERELVCLRL